MAEFRTFFSGDYIDRLGEIRNNEAALSAALINPASRFLPIFNERCLIQDDHAAMLTLEEVSPLIDDLTNAIFLGELAGNSIFAVALTKDEDPSFSTDCTLAGLRELTDQIAEQEAALLAYAKAMVGWQRRHRHCGICGTHCQPAEGGFVMTCSQAACSHRSFPRLDPAIIVLVHADDKCLLGRQTRWPDGRFSTIAGFVEPGESLEDSVRREVHEETNIRIGRCRYMASQPWPFPAALMIGFLAEGISNEIRLNDGELAEARWLTRDDIAGGKVVLPPRVSIAYRLLETWFDEGSGANLESLDLPAPPLRDPR
jgi:NAD+ diphosphatase